MIKEDILSDNRFHISEDDLIRIEKNDGIYGYKFKEIKLKRIYRWTNKGYKSIRKTETYRYLSEHDSSEAVKKYSEYCDVPINREDNKNRSIKTFDSLIQSLEEEGYLPTKNVIVVDQYKCLINGFHRTSFLLWKYGGNYSVPVLIIKTKFSIKRLLYKPVFCLCEIVRGSML